MKRVHQHQAQLLALLITSGISTVHAADNDAICSAMDIAALEPALGAMYAAARISNSLVFVSGQIGVDPASAAPAPDFDCAATLALSERINFSLWRNCLVAISAASAAPELHSATSATRYTHKTVYVAHRHATARPIP